MLAKEVKKTLVDSIIPFWMGMKDEEFGGFYGMLDYELRLDKKAEKGCILNSRILWFFSNAYQVLHDEKLLYYAAHAYEFLTKYGIDKINGGVYWSLNYNGTKSDGTKHTYNQAFAIYALSSYYAVTKEKEVLKQAYELFNLIEEKCKDEYGYLESFDEKFRLIKNDKLSENGIIADKTMNTLLHVFEAYTELYRVTRDKQIGARLKDIMDNMTQFVYNPDKRRQEVFFDVKMHSILDLHSYGHDIEAAWLIDRGCELLNGLKPILIK